MMAFIKAQRIAGKRYEWNVTEPDVRICSNTAWIAYVNKGSIIDASGRMGQQWLESGFLEKQAGRQSAQDSLNRSETCRWPGYRTSRRTSPYRHLHIRRRHRSKTASNRIGQQHRISRD